MELTKEQVHYKVKEQLGRLKNINTQLQAIATDIEQHCGIEVAEMLVDIAEEASYIEHEAQSILENADDNDKKAGVETETSYTCGTSIVKYNTDEVKRLRRFCNGYQTK